jgi:hypothetical protein
MLLKAAAKTDLLLEPQAYAMLVRRADGWVGRGFQFPTSRYRNCVGKV